MRSILLIALLATTGTAAAARAPDPNERLAMTAGEVSAPRMKATIEKLVSFGTRHTLSSQTDKKRGIGAAQRWAKAEFLRIGKGCGKCLTIAEPSEVVTGRRIPTPTKVWDVLAIQRGTERSNDVVIISGHIDSRVTDVMNANAEEPGANDDGSGVAAAFEAARILSKQRFPGTIVYAVLMGEEQGLYGGKVLADYAKAQGWNVIANLNNDIMGSSCGSDGVCNDKVVRVFSEGPRWQGHEELAAQIRSLGGENDAPSRNLSRFLDSLAERVPSIGLDVMQVWRNDRFGRGGDHTELLNAGYPAVRLSVAVENYNWQHQDVRVENGVEYGDTVDKVDFPYLAKVTKLNVAALAALASAPPPPEPTVEGAVSTDTTVSWTQTPSAEAYVLHWRRTDANQWEKSTDATLPPKIIAVNGRPVESNVPATFRQTLPHIRVDDWVFGVSSVSADGYESSVASAVPGGAFKPWVKPAEEKK